MQLLLERLLLLSQGNGMLNDASVISLQVTVVPRKTIDILLHQVDVSLSRFREKGLGQLDDFWLGRSPDVYFFDLVIVWGQPCFLRDVVLVKNLF